MCRHILNAQVSVRAQCCKRWFECVACHDEVSDHPLRRTVEMVFACKKCRKTFRKDMDLYEEQDEFCPHCDNQYVIEAVTPHMELGFETEDLRKDASFIKDSRLKQKDLDPTELMEVYRRKMLEQMVQLDETEL